jgi:hypothetical protein
MIRLAALMSSGIALPAALLAGCTTERQAMSAPSPAAERLTIAVGPCYGTCPVYSVELGPDGEGLFRGEQHVAVSGTRTFTTDPAVQRALTASLAPYRPIAGTTTQTRCEQQVSDQSSYTLTWTTADGRKTVLTHDRGCRSAANARLNVILDELPDRLRLAALIGRR